MFHDAMKVSGGRILMINLPFECDYVCHECVVVVYYRDGRAVRRGVRTSPSF